MLLPHLGDLLILDVRTEAGTVLVDAVVATPTARCSGCGTSSARVHSRYRRRLADAAVAGRKMVLRLMARRFFCVNTDCQAKTFAEQVDGLTVKRSRRTDQLTAMLTRIAVALAGRAGARLAAQLGLPGSRDTLLRLIRAQPDPPVGAITVLGVDDFAVKRSRRYATILLDMATHRPIDVLDGREANPLAAWLSRHPEVEVITRDRSGAYSEAARRGAPQATQCADRWHLWQNLCQAVEKTVVAHRGCLTESSTASPDPIDATHHTPGTDTGKATTSETTEDTALLPESPRGGGYAGLHARTAERFEAVQRLRAQGKGLRTIAKELDIDRKTARRYALAASPEDVIATVTSRASMIDEFVPHLLTRWNAGHTNIAALITELRELGYRGSPNNVYRFLRPYQASKPSARPALSPPKPRIRAVTSWITRDPDTLPDAETRQLTTILTCCPELAATRRHVGAFAVLMRDRRGDRLPEWIASVRADDLPAMHSFAIGLEHDFAAVTAGLTLHWSNGPTEGTVNKVKALKRQCFGRSNLDLLRKRILLSHNEFGSTSEIRRPSK
ncbi:ISL3 family transposase [Nocardia anaemiae]|uniref:ISL3 family transposase n=1 Tax=Nocardia anaemiae TaxID=263910 RepID=UPI0007C7C309|nr:ISL3 family transposase [Nocardia anaemiae]